GHVLRRQGEGRADLVEFRCVRRAGQLVRRLALCHPDARLRREVPLRRPDRRHFGHLRGIARGQWHGAPPVRSRLRREVKGKRSTGSATRHSPYPFDLYPHTLERAARNSSPVVGPSKRAVMMPLLSMTKNHGSVCRCHCSNVSDGTTGENCLYTSMWMKLTLSPYSGISFFTISTEGPQTRLLQ